jgi:DNA-binding PadR family transcriptional regulator
MRAEELKGRLDALPLAALEGGPRHGYAVTEALRQDTGERLDLPTGTIYPALRRLTAAGLQTLAGWRAAWQEFAATASAVLEGGPCPDPA